jgi:hypothetical protein
MRNNLFNTVAALVAIAFAAYSAYLMYAGKEGLAIYLLIIAFILYYTIKA